MVYTYITFKEGVTKMTTTKTRTYVRTDKNGTEIYHDYTCDRCGGQGWAEAWAGTGLTCYKCSGSGKQSNPTVYKKYTPEYRAKLDARRKAKEAKAEIERIENMIRNSERINREFIDNKFFGQDAIAVYMGNTYEIKEELKLEGARFISGIGWYNAETKRDHIVIDILSLLQADEYSIYSLKSYDELESIIARLMPNKSTSTHQGEVGKRYTWELTVESVHSFSVESYSGYGTDTVYINKMIDSHDNVFIWKTGRPLRGQVTITGTVKEHSEYKGIQQTVLTRCRVAQ